MSEGGGGGPEFGPREEQLAPGHENLKGEEFKQALHPKVAKILIKIEDELKKYESLSPQDKASKKLAWDEGGISGNNDLTQPEIIIPKQVAENISSQRVDYVAGTEQLPHYPNPKKIIAEAVEYAYTSVDEEGVVSRKIQQHIESRAPNELSGLTAPEIKQKYAQNPEAFKYEYLESIIVEELEYAKTVKSRFDKNPQIKKLKAATNAAINALFGPDNKNTPPLDTKTINEKAVNIYLHQDENGEWSGSTEQESNGENEYITLTESSVKLLKSYLSPFDKDINQLTEARDAIRIMEDGGKLPDNDGRAKELDIYINEKINSLEEGMPHADVDQRKNRFTLIELLKAYKDKTFNYNTRKRRDKNIFRRKKIK